MVPQQAWIVCALGLVLVLCLPLAAEAEQLTSGSINGIVVDAETGEKLAGVTIIAMLGKTQLAAISDGNGVFRFEALPAGDWQLHLIYGETSIKMRVTVMPGQKLLLKQKLTLEWTGCSFLWTEPMIDTLESGIREKIDEDSIKNIPPPRLSSHFPTYLQQSPREGLYLVSGLNTSASPSHVNREFVDEISVARVGLGPESRSSLGTIREITLKNGTNEFAGSVLGQTGRTQSGSSYALATQLGGPIKKDKAWFFVGGAAALSGPKKMRSLSRQVLARLDYAASYERSGQLNYLTTSHNNVNTDDIGAQWTEKLFDAKTVLSAGTALHQGVARTGQDRRFNASLGWIQRFEALGYHKFTSGVRVDVDRLKNSGHALGTDAQGRNAAFFMQESWMVKPNVTINTALRYDKFSVERSLSSNALSLSEPHLRVRGSSAPQGKGTSLNTSSRFEPRFGVAYDWTREGRSKLFGSVARLHPGYRLVASDQGRQGFADEAVVGAEYELAEGMVVGGDYQGRRSPVPQFHLDALTIRVFNAEPVWSRNLHFRASYSYVKAKNIEGTTSRIGPHRFRFEGYYQRDVGIASHVYLGWSLRAANKGYGDSNLRVGFKRDMRSDRAIDVFADVASTQLPEPGSLLATNSESTRDGSKLQLSVRYSY